MIRKSNITYSGWLGGMNNKKAANQLSPYELSDVLNFHYDQQGACIRRGGTKRKNSAANVLSDVQVWGLFAYRERDGGNNVLIANGADLRVWDGTNNFALFGSGGTTSVGRVTDNTPCRFVVMQNTAGTDNIAICTDNGVKELTKIYRTGGNLACGTLTTLAGDLQGKHLAVWNDQLWVGNITDNGSGVKFPGDAWFSADNDPESGYAATRSIEFNRNDGDEITGLAVLGANLIVFKRNSIWYVSGKGLTTYRKDILAYGAGVGCIAPDSIQVIGDAVYFLTANGVAKFSFDGGLDLIGDPIKGTMDTLLSQDLTKLVNCKGAHDPILNHYILACPSATASTINNTFLVYTYRDVASMAIDKEQAIYRGAWGIYTGTNYTACSMAWVESSATPVGTLTTRGFMWMGGYDGYVRQAEVGNLDDVPSDDNGGTVITAHVTLGDLDLGAPNQRKRMLALYPVGQQNVNFYNTVEFATEYATGYQNAASISFGENVTTVPLFDTGVICDTGVLFSGGTGALNAPTRKKINLSGASGHRIRPQFSCNAGNGQVKLLAIGIEFQNINIW